MPRCRRGQPGASSPAARRTVRVLAQVELGNCAGVSKRRMINFADTEGAAGVREHGRRGRTKVPIASMPRRGAAVTRFSE